MSQNLPSAAVVIGALRVKFMADILESCVLPLIIWNPFRSTSLNHKYNTVESRKFEVLGTRGFISKYRKFELKGGRHKIFIILKKITIFIAIKCKFWARKRNVSMRRFFYAPKTYVIIDNYKN